MSSPTSLRAIRLLLGLGGIVGGFGVPVPPLAAAPLLRDAANLGATPADQLAVAGNACGPAALLNAFRFGDHHWQRAATAVAGDTDKARLLAIIRTWGLRPSRHLAGRLRWTRHGVNVDDLCDMANEMTRGQLLPQVQLEILMLQPGETSPGLLQRVHGRLASSLANGLPPIISIRRIAHRSEAGQPPEWVVVQGHFVTVVGLPRKLVKNATAFPVTYIDPWGGKRGEGRLTLSRRAFLPAHAPATAAAPCLEADFPQVSVGNDLLRAKDFALMTLAAAIGRW